MSWNGFAYSLIISGGGVVNDAELEDGLPKSLAF
jgi:hypothetical protein